MHFSNWLVSKSLKPLIKCLLYLSSLTRRGELKTHKKVKFSSNFRQILAVFYYPNFLLFLINKNEQYYLKKKLSIKKL